MDETGREYRRVAVFGAGRIGAAVAQGLLAAGHPPDRLIATTRDGRHTARTKGMRLTANTVAASEAEVAMICVKPQDVRTLLDEIEEHLDPSAIVVSLASGLPTQWFESRLKAGASVVRVMTTLGIEVGEGASVLSPGLHATPEDLACVSESLSVLGLCVEAPESYLDAVSAVSGGGIAYIYFLVEAMTHAGVSVGLPSGLARELLIQAVVGAGAIMRQSRRHPVQLREDVMSRGGQTIAGFRELERHNVRTALFEAVTAARDRGITLAAEVEKQS